MTRQIAWIRIVTALICLLSSWNITAQKYYTKQYRVESGLPSDIIKASIQDSLGFFWIATDEGLVKYDGIQFTNFREKFHSNFVKGFHVTNDGRLLVYGDLDLKEIIHLRDTVYFKDLYAVDRTENDATLAYPKLIYEDSQNLLWVSESQAVVKLHKGAIKRYEFDINNRTTQFLRSFSLFEDRQNNLYTNSFQGNLFKFIPEKDKFEQMEINFPPDVEFVSVFDTTLIIGALSGIYSSPLLPDGGLLPPTLIKDIPMVSYIEPLGNDEYFVATRNEEHYIANFKKNEYYTFPYSINNLNHVYTSNEGDIWVSGNEGWFLIKENIFKQVNLDASDFIEAITEDPITKKIYYATNTTLYSYDKAKDVNSSLLKIPSGYFQSLIGTNEGVWISNAFKVLLFENGIIKKEYDFSDKKRFITGLSRDKEGKIWLVVPGMDKVHMIDRNGELKHFKIFIEEKAIINNLKTSEKGVYAVCPGIGKYLFFKDNQDTVFRNISLPIDFPEYDDFDVTDLVCDKEVLWLATSHGLMKYDFHSVSIVDLDERFNDLPIKSIHRFSKDKLLLANAFGLIIYDVKQNTYELYNESTGIPSNTITSRGFYVSQDSTIWIGTSKGLCFNKYSLTKNKKTPTPQIIQLIDKGKRAKLNHSNELSFNSFLTFQFSCITFPEDEVYFKYRILPEQKWTTITGNEFGFNANRSGEFSLEVIAKKNGAFSWSDPAHITFTIEKPFWQKWWFYLIGLIILLLLVALTTYAVSISNEKRNKKLQQLIDKRTEELRNSNDKLIRLNNEKNNLIGIVAHDLKNPINQIKGLLTIVKKTGKLDEDTKKNLQLVDSSASRMNEMIVKILDVNAIESEQLNVNIERENISEILGSVIDHFKTLAKEKRITLKQKIEADLYAKVDKNYLVQVLENLLSNAIKFSPFDKSIYIYLSAENDQIITEIKDEGPGISDEDKKRLFGKYQRLSAKPTGNEVSTGLGLMIAKKFVDAIDGNIWCESKIDQGTSFFVSFRKG